jgi:hypothetical protein
MRDRLVIRFPARPCVETPQSKITNQKSQIQSPNQQPLVGPKESDLHFAIPKGLSRPLPRGEGTGEGQTGNSALPASPADYRDDSSVEGRRERSPRM